MPPVGSERRASCPRLEGPRWTLTGIRIDSGDLAELATRARRVLDQNGLHDVPIFASGNLDENKIQALIRGGAPIDAFGVGTEMDVSSDAPSLDIAYKLSEYNGIPRIKLPSASSPYLGASRFSAQ